MNDDVSDDESEPVPPGAAQPGDFVFVEKAANDTLGGLIVELDGSDFSHVGFVNDKRLVVNARTRQLNTARGPGIGGVVENTLADLYDGGERTLWIGRTDFGSDAVEAAVRRVTPWIELDGSANRSAFSFAKLFIVAAALDAVHQPTAAHPALPDDQRRELLASARATATLWDPSNLEVPAFYCSELVAVAFDLTFPVSALTPPAPSGSLGLAEDYGDDFPELSPSDAVLALIAGVTDPAFRSLVELAATAAAYDWYFARRAVSAAAAFVWEKVSSPARRSIDGTLSPPRRTTTSYRLPWSPPACFARRST